MTSVLYAIRPHDNYNLSEPGKIEVAEYTKTYLEPDNKGKHRYLIVNNEQRYRILKALMYVTNQPPVKLNV